MYERRGAGVCTLINHPMPFLQCRGRYSRGIRSLGPWDGDGLLSCRLEGDRTG